MLEKPDFPDDQIIASLWHEFGLRIVEIAFLAVGGDADTAVYRAAAADGVVYFVKLRHGEFDATSVALPRLLFDSGITQIIPPQRTRSGQLWAEVKEYSLILYLFVAGINGYDVELSASQWAEFGAAVKRIHTLPVPASLTASIRREGFSPEWRDRCRAVFQRLEAETFADSISAAMAALLGARREMVLGAIERAEAMAEIVSARSLEFVLCHNDLHPGNLLLDAGGGVLIVDWDYPILAPKERDLMFIGGGQGFKPYAAEQQELLFYQGYAPAQPDPTALAYYRYERGITDITVESERILSDTLGRPDRARSLEYLGFYFLPGCTLEMARAGDPGPDRL